MFSSRIPSWATSYLRPTLLFVAFAVSAVLSPSNLYAHAALVRSSPSAQQTLSKPPETVELSFSEEIRIIRMSVVTVDGGTRDLSTTAVGSKVTAKFPDRNSRGTVIVTYRVESEDGHPIGGSVMFNIGAASKVPTSVDRASEVSLPLAVWVTRTATILVLAVIVGGAFFDRWFASLSPSGFARTIQVAAGVAILFSALYIQGLDEMGVGLVFYGGEPLSTAVQGRMGLFAALALFSMLVVALPNRGLRQARTEALLALVLASAAFTVCGHASTATPQWLARGGIFLHAGAMFVWIGSLFPLWQLSRLPTDHVPLRKFSGIVPFPYWLIVFSGATLALIQIVDVRQLLQTLYGQVLIVKIGLVGCLSLLAAYNRFWLTKPVLAGNAAARARLRRSVGGEILLAVAIVATASLWRFAGPAQPGLYVPKPPMAMHMHAEKAMAQLELSQKVDGGSRVQVFLLSPDFDPLYPEEVTLRLDNPSIGVEPLEFTLRKAADGSWETGDLPAIDTSGWVVDLEVLLDDFNLVHIDGDLGDLTPATAP